MPGDETAFTPGPLPTRATDVNDIFWNVLGTIAGCAAAHLHRNVRLDWQ